MKRSRYHSSPTTSSVIPNSRFDGTLARAQQDGSSGIRNSRFDRTWGRAEQDASFRAANRYALPTFDRYEDYYRDLVGDKVRLRFRLR